MSPHLPAPTFRHLLGMSDGIGLFEHADHATPRREHGYCVDDVARALIALSRQEDLDGADHTPELRRLAWTYLRFLEHAQEPDGSIVNRRDVDGVRHGVAGVEDCWGRALWGFGTAAGRSRDLPLAESALHHFDVSARLRSPWPRAMAFAGLGAVEVLRIDSSHALALDLLAAAVPAIGRAVPGSPWPWPQPRLTYADAVLPDLLLAAGDLLGRAELVADGLLLLDWLLGRQREQDHLSLTPVGGSGPGGRRAARRFDQQPIEAATLADACARAYEVTGEQRWADAVQLAAGWFLGANDQGVALIDLRSGGCADGLTVHGRNENQGAESTLAMITTLQHAHRLARVPS